MMSDLLLRLCRFSELTSKPTSFFPICRDGLFSQRDQTRFYITVGVCSVLVAVMAVRMDVRDSRNDRMRSLCAVYWGAPDGSPEESRALVQAERSTGISNLEMLSYCRFYGDQ